MSRRWTVLAILAALPPLASACMWDRDTAAEEAEGLLEVVSILTGRFPRNPPLYYSMRLQRVAEHLKADPEDLGAYDDAGVACDRLGRGDEAIAWMKRKAERLAALPVDDHLRLEHEYRHHANLGTFLVHRWLREGADRARISEVEAATAEIARAIEINRNAHFGREKYQLLFLKWILDPPRLNDQDRGYLPHVLNFREFAEGSPLSSVQAREVVIGLSGLIALGNAWESIDVFNALRAALEQDTTGFLDTYEGGRNVLAYLARLRCEELAEAGKASMIPGAPKGPELAKWIRFPDVGDRDGKLKAAFHRLRGEADDWQADRTRYMLARLEQGRHPDDDPRFWEDYKEPPPPELPDFSVAPIGLSRAAIARENMFILAAALGLVTVTSLGVFLIARRRRKRKALGPLA